MNRTQESARNTANVIAQELKGALSEIRNEQQLLKAAAAESQRSADRQRGALRLFGESQTSQHYILTEEMQSALCYIREEQRRLGMNAMDSQQSTRVQLEVIRQLEGKQTEQKMNCRKLKERRRISAKKSKR